MKKLLMAATLFLVGCSQPNEGDVATNSDRPFSQNDWDAYKSAHVSGGRVIDGPSGNVSHSEGQGFAMILAVAADDQETFAELWLWTVESLRPAREDGLFGWRWNPETESVDDANNATDGDILIAWALLKASEKWSIPDFKIEALKIMKVVRSSMIRQTPIGPVLLPAGDGYEQPGETVVNPSYWVFPAFDDFARVDAVPSVWLELSATGLRLLEAARFGKFQLPGDWVAVSTETGEVMLPTGEQFSREFGYNAIRVPLYLIWSGYRQMDLFFPYLEFSNSGEVAATIDLVTDAPGADSVMPGGLSIYELVNRIVSPESAPAAGDSLLIEGDAYYSASLHLLTQMASQSAR